eukprot:9333608-Pyramimonas_sp.AAC.1
MTAHMAWDFAPQANPRAVQAYLDEDFVGRTKRVASRCHGATFGHRSVLRYCILVGVRWWKELARLRGLRCDVSSVDWPHSKATKTKT